MATVRILNGPNRNQTFVLQGGELVGRDPTNKIQVFAPGVSRKHFKFDHENGKFFVQDLGSSNGTYVNNLKISKHILIESDTITVGGINLLYSDNDGPGPVPALNFSTAAAPQHFETFGKVAAKKAASALLQSRGSMRSSSAPSGRALNSSRPRAQMAVTAT